MRLITEPEEVLNTLLDLDLIDTPRRSPKDRQDFGDKATYGLMLRRLPWKGIKEADILKDFAVYLGQHKDTFLVGIKNHEWHVYQVEVFDSLFDLYQCWELD